MSMKEKILERGMKLISDPRVVRLISNPRVMHAVGMAFELRGKAQATYEAKVKQIAKTLKLATPEEVAELKRTIRTLQDALVEAEAKPASKPDAPKTKRRTSKTSS